MHYQNGFEIHLETEARSQLSWETATAPHQGPRKSNSLAVSCVPVAGNQSAATQDRGEMILVVFCPNCSTGLCHKLRDVMRSHPWSDD